MNPSRDEIAAAIREQFSAVQRALTGKQRVRDAQRAGKRATEGDAA